MLLGRAPRDSTAAIGLAAPAVEAAFGGPKGYAAVADGEDGAKLVITSTEVTVPPYFSGAPFGQSFRRYAFELVPSIGYSSATRS